MVPYVGRPELRFYVSDSSGLDLVWSQVMTDGREVGELAEQKRREFEAKGWSLDPWKVLRVRNGVRQSWTEGHESLEDAFATVQAEHERSDVSADLPEV